MKDQIIIIPTSGFNAFKPDLDGRVFHRDYNPILGVPVIEIKFALKKWIPTAILKKLFNSQIDI